MKNIKVFLTNLGKYNEGELVGEWVTVLGTGKTNWAKVKKDIGISDQPDKNGNYYEEYFITDYESEIPNLEINEYMALSEVDKLQDALNKATKNNISDDFIIALYEYSTSNEFINNLANADNYLFLPNVKTNFDLGYYFVNDIDNGPEDLSEDILISHFNYEQFGRDISIEDPDVIPEDIKNDNRAIGIWYTNEIEDVKSLGKDLQCQYFDYEYYGRDIQISTSGMFTSKGYLQGPQ